MAKPNLSQLYLSWLSLAKLAKLNFFKTPVSDSAKQRGLMYTEDKPLGRLCKICNPFFYEFRLTLSTNVFQLVCYIANLFTTEAAD